MKKLLVAVLVLTLCLAVFTGCGNTPAETEAPEGAKISPLPQTTDINNLGDCTLSVSFEEGDIFTDDSGKTQLKATVYTYDLYDMVDIANLKEGDVLVRNSGETKIETIERKDTGLIVINGGLENGGFDLFTDESTVYYESGFNDHKSYYSLGEVTLPLADDFIYFDESDLDNEPKEYKAEELLSEVEYNFFEHNTTIVIQDGAVIELHKRYIP